MAQEEHNLSSSHSGGGDSGGGVVSSDRSRNVKQKKVPQRGLGVAQLEKIRLEEQRKREAANGIGDAVHCPSFVPSLSPSSTDFQSPYTVYNRLSPSIPIQISNQLNGGVEDNGNWSRLWSGDYTHRNDYLGAAFRPQGNLRAAMPHRSFRFHQPASPVVNPSAVLASYMEPPSNQNIHGSNCNYASSWKEEYKMVGMKRSYPFSLETPPARSFPGHFNPSSVASDDLPSCSSGYTAQKEARNIYISFSRDGRSNPGPLPEQNPREVLRDDGRLNGDFLTLAPPAASNSKHNHPLDHSGFEGPEENIRNQVHHHSGPSRSREEPVSFFPVRSDIDESSGRVSNGNGEKGETIDLNLKL